MSDTIDLSPKRWSNRKRKPSDNTTETKNSNSNSEANLSARSIRNKIKPITTTADNTPATKSTNVPIVDVSKSISRRNKHQNSNIGVNELEMESKYSDENQSETNAVESSPIKRKRPTNLVSTAASAVGDTDAVSVSVIPESNTNQTEELINQATTPSLNEGQLELAPVAGTPIKPLHNVIKQKDSDINAVAGIPATPTSHTASSSLVNPTTPPPTALRSQQKANTAAASAPPSTPDALKIIKYADKQLYGLIQDSRKAANEMKGREEQVKLSMELIKIDTNDFGTFWIPEMLLERLEYDEFISRLYYICKYHKQYDVSLREGYLLHNQRLKDTLSRSSSSSSSSSTNSGSMTDISENVSLETLWDRRHHQFLGTGMFYYISVLVDVAVKLYQTQQAKIPIKQATKTIVRQGCELWGWHTYNSEARDKDSQFKAISRHGLVIVSYLMHRPWEIPLLLTGRVTKTMFNSLAGKRVDYPTILENVPDPVTGLFIQVLSDDKILQKKTPLGQESLSPLITEVLDLTQSRVRKETTVINMNTANTPLDNITKGTTVKASPRISNKESKKKHSDQMKDDNQSEEEEDPESESEEGSDFDTDSAVSVEVESGNENGVDDDDSTTDEDAEEETNTSKTKRSKPVLPAPAIRSAAKQKSFESNNRQQSVAAQRVTRHSTNTTSTASSAQVPAADRKKTVRKVNEIQASADADVADDSVEMSSSSAKITKHAGSVVPHNSNNSNQTSALSSTSVLALAVAVAAAVNEGTVEESKNELVEQVSDEASRSTNASSKSSEVVATVRKRFTGLYGKSLAQFADECLPLILAYVEQQSKQKAIANNHNDSLTKAETALSEYLIQQCHYAHQKLLNDADACLNL